MPRFVHLHVHSHYSLLDGLSKIRDLVSRAKELGMEAVALTDHGVMYGAIEFYKECKAQGIKPIIGMEAYVAPESHLTKNSDAEKYFHLTLLAKNLAGYKNLVKLTTIGHLKGFYYKPRIDKKLLEEHSEGIIALSGCLQGEISRAFVAGKYETARDIALYYQNLFGKDNFYLEVQDHPKIKDQTKVNEGVKKLSKETGIGIVATADSHYLRHEDAEAQDIMLCVQTGKTVHDPTRFDMRDCEVSFKSEEEMSEVFKDLPEAIENTGKIAEMCDITLELGKWRFAKYALPEGKTADEYLRELATKGLEEKYKLPQEKILKEVRDRLDYELDIISKKGFSEYFLIVADYVNWARAQGIICATRGSAAGSLASYCIGITAENPLNFGLPFERFLNPSRPSPPDIDMDFADDRREEVLEYVREKYGRDKVAQICTFGAMMARAAVRDVARASGFPYNFADRISKMIPFGLHGFHMTIDEAMKQNPELKSLYEREADAKKVIDLAKKMEGCVRHASVHAAGVVISPTDITDFTPLQLEPGGGNIITQYDMHAVEDVGLVKMDFLGVRNLSILGLARDLIKKIKGVEIDFQKLGFDDKKTYELLARGDTMGVFQLSGSGMTRYLKELKPSNIFDIMAMVALYRPGPINSIPEFIRRKHNSKLITYLDPRLEEILNKSYGVLTFQDDVLLIAIKLAGYNWEEADKLRKAMGKKIPAEMAKQKEKFIKGCIANNVSQLKAETLWLLIEPFAAYGFNKAHAASYAVISYHTAYLKTYYPAEYMTAIFTAEAGNMEKTGEAISECRRIGIEVLPPSVNESNESFTCNDDKHIRFGLLSIKNVGTDIAAAVIQERNDRGKYDTLEDFLTRVPSKNLNKKSLEAFIMGGALDEFYDRRVLLDNSEKLLSFRREIVDGKNNNNQASLFAAIAAGFAKPKLNLEVKSLATTQEKLVWEKELLGLYLSDHPFRKYKDSLPQNASALRDLAELTDGSHVLVGGVISSIKRIFSRQNEPMYFLKCDDETAQVEIVVFPSVAKKVHHLIIQDAAVLIKGKLTTKDGEPKILADSLTRFDELTASTKTKTEKNIVKNDNSSGVVQIQIADNQKSIESLKKVLATSPGEHLVFFVLGSGLDKKHIETNVKINFNNSLKEQIEELVGKGTVNFLKSNHTPLTAV